MKSMQIYIVLLLLTVTALSAVSCVQKTDGEGEESADTVQIAGDEGEAAGTTEIDGGEEDGASQTGGEGAQIPEPAGPTPGETAIFDEIEFVWIPPGTFTMGSPQSEKERDDDEQEHQVTISQGFWMGKYEVTQAQWQSVMGSTPSHFKGAGLPVERVSWRKCQTFVQTLNSDGGGEYRLPAEAEWEYACRAGSTGAYSFGDSEADLDNYGWYSANGISKTHSVGEKMPNAWGLYDMHGNVWEWCSDWYAQYPDGPETDPTGPSSGSSRVLRGGSWFLEARDCRSAYRTGHTAHSPLTIVGFRICRAADEEEHAPEADPQ